MQASAPSCGTALRLSPSRDHPKPIPSLKGIYPAPDRGRGRAGLDAFEVSDLGERYPAVGRTWRSTWPEFTPYLAFPRTIRTVV
ncbi:transposase [Streptomyces vinaceus]|uniref:transposase n=1 Tax=Streptomyces vinaceus TaxID=1960 RepID=UPI0037F64304